MIWIERQRYFLDFTLSALWRRKWKNLALLLVYALVIFLVSSVIFFAEALREEAKTILKGSPDMIVQRTVAGRHALMPLSYLETIKAIRGVRSVTPRLWGYYYHPLSRSNYTLMVSEDFPYGDRGVEVGQGVLRTLKAVPGDRLYLKAFNGETVVLNIEKTFAAPSELVTADLILMSENTFRRLTGIPLGFATDLAATIRNQKECPIIAEKIAAMLPDTRPILREEILRTYSSLFDWRSGYALVLLTGAVLAFFIFAWDKATGLSAEERAEIGILKGIGWDTSDVLTMKFWEGCVISLTAFLLGIMAAYIHVYLCSAPFFEHALKGWATLYPSFRLKPSFDMYQLTVLFLLTVFPYSFITLFPAWKVATTDPDIVMRQG